MRGDEFVRSLRQQRGLSQRALAQLAGVSTSTVARIEAGAADPSWRVISRLAAACGRDLAVALPAVPADEATTTWLHLSVSERLYRSLGGQFSALRDRSTPVWTELGALSEAGLVVVAPEASLGVWLPAVRAPDPFPVTVVAPWWRRDPLAVSKASRSLTVSFGPASLTGLVPVGVTHRRDVLVHPPSAPQLAVDPMLSARLRGVASLLDGGRQRDGGGRHVPAHRFSTPVAEFERVLGTKRYGLVARDRPDPRRRRDARLDGEASFQWWLSRRGYPD